MATTLNLCNLPAWVVASREFAVHPEALEIQGVRVANRWLFTVLDETDPPERRAEVFHEYMAVKFQLHHEDGETKAACRCIRNSYLRFVRGWGVDSNSREAAVLKGWVESRIGLEPTFHRGRIDPKRPRSQMPYLEDRMQGSKNTNAILSQLDLVYEFCQYELRKRRPNTQHWTLYRGTWDADDYVKMSDNRAERTTGSTVRLNSLSSFTSDREKAWEFGSTVWSTAVPHCKILFFGELLPPNILKGENEFLVIGGDYPTEPLLY